jgi:hypothetical protein
MNDLIEASAQVCSKDELAAFDGSVGLDATPVPLWSRGPSARSGTCASDPDGGWYVSEGDHREAIGPDGKVLRKLCWATEATIATMGRPPGAVPGHPNLALGVALGRPGESPGPPGHACSPPCALGAGRRAIWGRTAAIPRAGPSTSTYQSGLWVIRWSWTTRPPSSGAKPTAAGRSWSTGPFTAQPCPKRS